MTEAAAAATAAAGGQGGVLGHAYMDLVPLSLPVVTAADGQQQQPQRQTLHLPRHPLARLAAWQLALLALAADADGGLGMPPPAVIPRPRQPSFSSPRSPNLHDPVYYAQSPYSTGGVTAAPLVAVTPELPRAVLGLALAGPGVCRLLRLLGAFARGAGLVASLHGGDNRHLATQPAVGEEVLGVTVTLLAALAEDSPPRELHATASLAGLASRRVVEAAALYYPRPAALLYSRFLAFAPEPSVPAAVLRALVERALDAGAMAGGSGGDAAGAQQYAGGRSAYQSAAAQQHAQQTQRRLLAAGARPLLSVLQAALSVGEDSGELQVFRLQQTLPLVERCTRLLSRRGASGGAGSGALPHELDLVYEVARMYMAVAAANPTAAAFVAAELGAPLTEWRRLLTGRQGGW